jgi:LPXTG-motif cell wall-anchored protein
MATESELKREIADERRELTNAVASLREELGQTAEKGKKLGAAAGAVTGALLAAKTLLKLRRKRRD